MPWVTPWATASGTAVASATLTPSVVLLVAQRRGMGRGSSGIPSTAPGSGARIIRAEEKRGRVVLCGETGTIDSRSGGPGDGPASIHCGPVDPNPGPNMMVGSGLALRAGQASETDRAIRRISEESYPVLRDHPLGTTSDAVHRHVSIRWSHASYSLAVDAFARW